jgi:hypothetical protein
VSDVNPTEGLPPAEQAKLRFYFTSGSVIGGLGVLALATGESRTGMTSLVVGLAALVLGVKRGQRLMGGAGRTEPKAKGKTTATAKGKPTAKGKTGARAKARLTAEAAAFTAWYTVGLGLVLMGAGAATTVFARDAETRTAEVVLFLVAGVLLWMGVTCLIAARAQIRGRGGPAPKRGRPAVSAPDDPVARPPRRRPGAAG